jgi:hypothetical protein
LPSHLQHRRRGIASTILRALETTERLKINNIDENSHGALALLRSNGYKQVLNQYEMLKTL